MAPTTVPVAFTKTADPVGSGLVARTRRTPGFVHFLHATLPDEAIRAGPPAELHGNRNVIGGPGSNAWSITTPP